MQQQQDAAYFVMHLFSQSGKHLLKACVAHTLAGLTLDEHSCLAKRQFRPDPQLLTATLSLALTSICAASSCQ